jgi:cell division protein FtsB
VADNSAALRHARRRDSRIKRQRAADAIHAFEHGGEPISFPAVARRAGVSVSLLYADLELAGRIAAVRDRQQQAGRQRAWHIPARSLVTEQSLRAELTNTKEQVRQLTADVTLLRERLAHQLGVDADIARGWDTGPMLARLEQRAAELEADNHRLRRRVAELDGQVRDLTDNLDAARTMNRDLMNELNRDATPRRPRPASTEATKN